MKKWLTGCVFALGAAHAVAAELHFGNWPDYFPPALLAKFVKETGIKATLDTYDSDATLLTKLQAGGGGYDVVITGDYYVPVLAKNGLIQKLDKSKLPNASNIKPEYQHPTFDRDRTYAMPYLLLVTGIAYDSARVPGGQLDDTWKSFFDPPVPVRGEIGALDAEEEMYMAASWFLGQDECSENPEDAKRVLNVLEKQKPYVKIYSNDGTYDRLISKQVIVQHHWGGYTVRAEEKLPSIKFMYPREGVRFFMDSFVIPANAKNVNEAYAFINWMMKPENIAIASNVQKYEDAISGAEKYMDPKLLANPAVVVPKQDLARLRPFKMCSPAALTLRNRVWTKLKAD
ncbi:extracellular solute-binding protein [Paraburkholderia megapolitana]|uniref:extracellular solute-binding protein n=1 Tax=Paraburkholderia megapolitana TaxID=420953 RepID=UPI0038BAADB9